MSIAIATMGKFIPAVGGGVAPTPAAPFSGGGGFMPQQPQLPIIQVTFMEEDEDYPIVTITDIENGINGENNDI